MSIQNFEEQTKDLTKKELEKIVPIVSNLLADAKGLEFTTSSSKIIEVLRDRGFNLDDKRIRKIVQHIRKNHIVRGVIATSKGYYVSTSAKEIREYAHKSYGSRINEMAKVQKEILADADYFDGI